MKAKDLLKSLWMCYPSDVCFCVRYNSGVVIAGNDVVPCQVRWVRDFLLWDMAYFRPDFGRFRRLP